MRTFSSPTLLPQVSGFLRQDVPLCDLTWFRVGGLAEAFFVPQNEEDLSLFLKHLDPSIPVFVLGVGSNLLVRDGGCRGVTIRLGPQFSHLSLEDSGNITVGAFALDRHLARFALQNARGGCAFLDGIPGTIGGALRMNAGAHGSEIKDIFVEAVALDRTGHRHILSAQDMGFSYRTTQTPEDLIFISARFHTTAEDPQQIKKKMEDVRQARLDSQPIKSRTGGSTFKNPPGKKAWELIDRAGMRGARVGQACVSSLHCNFLINEGGATAHDLETLGNRVQAAVFDTSGITLEWEIKRVGDPLSLSEKFLKKGPSDE